MDEKTTAISRGYDNNARAIEIRLDTRILLADIESFLRGERTVEIPLEDGRVKLVQKKYGASKCNDEGIQNLLSWLSIMNAQVVQGNFLYNEKDGISTDYQEYICDFQKSLTAMIILKQLDWEIKDDDSESIIDYIMLLVRPFFSRLIDNKERESYGETFRSSESNKVEENHTSGFSLFKPRT